MEAKTLTIATAVTLVVPSLTARFSVTGLFQLTSAMTGAGHEVIIAAADMQVGAGITCSQISVRKDDGGRIRLGLLGSYAGDLLLSNSELSLLNCNLLVFQGKAPLLLLLPLGSFCCSLYFLSSLPHVVVHLLLSAAPPLDRLVSSRSARRDFGAGNVELSICQHYHCSAHRQRSGRRKRHPGVRASVKLLPLLNTRVHGHHRILCRYARRAL